jgi:hypothetical protein
LKFDQKAWEGIMANRSATANRSRQISVIIGAVVGAVALALVSAALTNLGRARATMNTVTLSGPDTLGRGLQDVYDLVLSDPAPPTDGLQVTLATDDPTSCVIAATENGVGTSPATLTVSAGKRRRTFALQSLPGGTGDCSVSITGSTPAGWTGNPLSVSVVQGQLHIRQLPHSTGDLAPNQQFFVETGVPAGTGRRLRFIQGLSKGTPDATVTVCSDQSNVGAIVNRFGQDVPPPGCEDNPISAPHSRTVPGDFQFDPVAGQAGTVTVSASAAGFTGDEQTVSVRASAVTIHGPQEVGAGLQDIYSVNLSDAVPTNQDVTVSVSDPARCVVALSEQGLGEPSITVTVPAGRYRQEFVVQGVTSPTPPDTTPCTLSADAGTFGTDTFDIDVMDPALRIRDLSASTTTFARNDPFFVDLGVPGERRTLGLVQEWSKGSDPTAKSPLTVTAQSDTPAVGTIVNATGVDVGNDGQETDNVPPGFSRTVPGNLQFDPITSSDNAVGVTVTAPGFKSDEQDVTVRPLTLQIKGSTTLGLRLQDDYKVLLVNSVGHSATDVTVTSQTPDLCQLSNTSNGQPATSIVVHISAADMNGPFVVQGAADVAPGDCLIQASADGYPDTDPFTIHMVTPGIEIQQLRHNIPSDGNYDPFFVQVGVPNSNNTALRKVQRLAKTPSLDLPIKVCSQHPEFGIIIQRGVDNPPASDDPAGQSCEDDTVMQTYSRNVPGNLQFDPVAPGFTLVQVLASGFTTMDRTGKVEVRVGGMAIQLGAPDKLGLNLQASAAVRLTEPAPAGGVTVTVTVPDLTICGVTNDPNAVAGSSISLSIPEGGTNADFFVAGIALGSCQLHATATGYFEDSAGFDVVPFAIEIVDLDGSIGTTSPSVNFGVRIGVPEGHHVSAQEWRPGAPSQPVTVCSSDVTIATINGSTCANSQFDPGVSEVPFTLQVTGTAGDALITAVAGGAMDSQPIHVRATVVNVRGGVNRLGKNLQATFFAVANNDGGVTVTLHAEPANVCITSLDPDTPGDSTDKTLTIAPGTTRAPFVLQALDVGTCTVSLSGAGIPATSRDVTVDYARLRIRALADSMSFLAPNDSFYVEIGPMNPNVPNITSNRDNRYGITQPLARRAGAPLEVAVCSSNPPVGIVLDPNGGAGSGTPECVSATIPGGSSQTDPLQFNPLTAGPTDVTAAAPGEPDVGPTRITIPVNPGSLTLISPDTIGNYLEAAAAAVFAPAPPDGTTLTISTSGGCGVSQTPDGCASNSLPLPVDPGRSRVDFYIQGLSVDTCTITLNSNISGFLPVSAVLDVVTPSARLRGVDSSESTAAKNDPFWVQLGVAKSNLKDLRFVQAVRADCPAHPLPITDTVVGFPLKVCSSDTNVGVIIGGVADGNCSRKVIPPTQSSTPQTIADGAYQFDPVGSGPTTVYVDEAGDPPVPLLPIETGSVLVNVVADTITVKPTTDIGVPLQDQYRVVLSRAAGVDGTVTLTSLTPSVCQVGQGDVGPFGATMTLTMQKGHTSADFVLQGLTQGDCILHAVISAAGYTYTPVDRTLNAVPFAARIINLDTTRSTQSADDPFNVEIGVANDALTNLAAVQDVRTGYGPTGNDSLPLTVCAINPLPPAPPVGTIPGSDSNGCKVVYIPQREHETHNGDLALDVLNAGTVTICVYSPTQIQRSCKDVVVATDVPSIKGPDTLGASLEENYTLRLSTAVQADTTFEIKNNSLSFDSSGICVLAVKAGDPSANSIQVTVTKGRTSASFLVRGVDDASGTCQLLAHTDTAGFTDGYGEITVQLYSAQIINLDTTRSTQSPNDPFNVQVGVADSRLVGLGDVQMARTDPDHGGTPVTVCVTNPPAPQPTVGVLVGADGDGCVQTNVPKGQNQTATNALVLDVQNPGTVTVCTTSPIPVRNSCKDVVVAADVATIHGPDPLGAGLQDKYTLSLSAAVGSDTDFKIETAVDGVFDTSDVCNVAPDATSAATSSITVTITKGHSSKTFYLHATDNVEGTCKISAQALNASGITDGYREAQVVPYSAQIINLSTSVSTQSANDPFNVEIGTANAGLTSVGNEEAARSDGGGITLTVCAINPPAPAATVATLLNADANGCVSTTINPGQSRTANNALVLDPMNAGTVVVCTTSPRDIEKACRDVVVGADVASVKGPDQLGSSLEDEYTLSLTRAVASDTTFTIGSQTGAFDSSDLCKVSLNETDVAQPSVSATVPSGRSQINFWIHGMDGVMGTCKISAHTGDPGITDAYQEIDVVTPGLQISGLAGTIKTSGANDTFVVQTGVPRGNLSGLSIVQERRFGIGDLTVTATSSDPTKAQIATSAGTAAAGTAPIMANNSETNADALALAPLAGGVTTVTASAPDFISTDAASKDVTVAQSTSSLTAPSGQTAVGSGLQDTFNIKLDPAAPVGGLPVTLASLTPSLCVVAPDESTAGTTTLSLTIPKGHTLQHYAIQALEGVTGTCTITVTTTNTSYTGDEFDVDIVQPAVRIRGLDSTTTIAAANDPFNIDVGVAKDNLTNLRLVQTVRAGAPSPLTVTACTSDINLGAVIGTATSDPACKSAPIAAGSSGTVNNALQFDPVAAGTVTVSAQAPGYITTDAGSVEVLIAPAALSFAHSTITAVGSGLMDTFTVKSSATVGSPTTVTITSLTPLTCAVAASESTAPANSVGVTIAAGHASTTFAIHGLEDTTGTCQLQATAAQFADGFGTWDIVQGGVRITYLSTSKSVGANDDPFYVGVGLPNASLSSLQTTQKVRTGSPGVVVTVCSSNPVIGSIVGPPAGPGCATTTIAAGQYQNGSLKFHTGTGGDTTTVTATAPNFITTDAGTVDVTVSGTGASLAIQSSNSQLGAGLQDGSFYVQAGANPASNVTVTVTSLTPSICLVSSSGSLVGGTSTTVTIPSTAASSNNFWVQALDGVLGTCSLKAAASFYPDGSGSVDVVTPAIHLSGLPTSILSTAANASFSVQIGVPNADLTDLTVAQAVRAGSAGFTVTISNATAVVAQLVSATPPSPAQTVTAVIAAQASGTTGLQFDPLAVGTTSVSATTPNATATTAATEAVSVTSGSGGGC